MEFLLIGVHWLVQVVSMRGSGSRLVIPRRKKGVGRNWPEPRIDFSIAAYEGRTACRNPASFAVASYWGIGSSSLNALVNAFDKLHMDRGWNSSCTG